ncbi:putative disease resistance RPP13-like protein 1 [Corylus avellana]|uniref:putative disease resistance RPP13-like protein 1 n=1 Tax=Corylus avellana TaxID=13451 RepID=UPI00286D1575|nr:putative disease resistance RPP13-like protein 1 [Corylus avellana]
MPVVELFIGAFLQVLLDRMASQELLNFARREGLGKKLDKWRKTLPLIQNVLNDAEEKKHTNEGVKQWVDDLRDLAYDLEDILDDFATEALVRKLRGENKVRNLMPACCTGLTPRALKIKIRLESKITEITDQFNDLMMKRSELRLVETVEGWSSGKTRTLAPTSVMNESRVYGRDKDKEALLKLLRSEKCMDAQVSVIPILGMGGIGKTTLAQFLFNDEEVQKNFDLKAWAYVSEDFDVVKVTKTILKNVDPESCNDNDDLNLLQLKLKEKLEGKKFLVVLDDLWNEKYNDWTILHAPFQAGAPGSKIIITTRSKRVSSMAGTVPAHNLQLLSNDFCLSLFTQHALEAIDFSAHPNLQDIGEEIVIKMCKGLPLVAKILGGLLRGKRDRDEWENILKRNILNIPEVKNEIIAGLMLSYNDLPSHIKRCFAYCSILPKGYEFEEEELVLLWMAEGLIQEREGDKQMKSLGSEYFQYLLSRSLFQKSRDTSRFMMHDLINDFAKLVAGDTCFRMEDQIGGSNGRRLPKKARHSSYMRGKYDSTKKFEDFFELTCLRTFLPLMLPSPGSPEQSYLTYNIPFQLFSKLRCLRVFSLNGYHIQELPDSIGDLKHLRYLNLSYTGIRSLPESTTTLCNLQTLILEGCSYLKELPSKLGNLVNLHHLNILNANKLEGMPPQIGKLTCLQTLSNLIVEKGNCFALKELGSLLHLQGTLIISRLENAIELGDASNAKLIEKLNLTELFLEWSVNVDDSQDRTSELEVLNMLHPNEDLKKFTIKCYGGSKFPTWLTCNSFHMVLLRIENCKKCTSLPPVGQLPSLKHLFIEGMTSVKNVGAEFSGGSCSQPFKSLETLCFKDMEEWESWSPNGEFPNLVELSIKNCPKLLGKLPNPLPLLKKVLVEECERLVVSISSFPELCELQIEGSTGVVCKSKVDFNSLNSKSLSKISEFTCPIEGFIFDVKDLAIENCEELRSLWSNDVGLLQTLSCLHALRVIECPKLIALVADEGNEQPQPNLPSTCNGMEYLPKAMVYNNKCLERIYIRGCDSLTHIAIGQLPPTLKWLIINDCKNMLILLYEDDTNSCSSNTSLLQRLSIQDCPSLKSLTSSGELHATLKLLRIKNCPKLESIAKSFHDNSSLEVIAIWSCDNLKSLPMGLDTLTRLILIDIQKCSALVSFPDEGLLPVNLEALLIFDCEKMQALPNCIHNITSLHDLDIWQCPMVSFPEEGFPTNLTSLQIWDCNITESLLNWGLHKLSSLRHLEIRGGCPHLESFPEMMLPASLTSLYIRDIPNLKYLPSNGFRYVSSLKTLRIGWCKKLKSFPEDGLPPSLLHLSIICCNNFTSFPKDGLPPSLHRLDIANCPRLKKRCKKVHGRERLKIAHIPCIQINGKSIYDPEENHPLDQDKLHALFWSEWKPFRINP